MLVGQVLSDAYARLRFDVIDDEAFAPLVLQDNTGLSIRRIIQTLRPIQQITVRIAGHEHRRGPTPTGQAILDALDADPH